MTVLYWGYIGRSVGHVGKILAVFGTLFGSCWDPNWEIYYTVWAMQGTIGSMKDTV